MATVQEAGRRLLPHVIDQRARDEPTKVWASTHNGVGRGFTEVSFSMLANAVNRAARWLQGQDALRPCLLDEPDRKPVVAYIGPSDLCYYVWVVAMAKAGCVPLYISHLNSVAANHHLFELARCKMIVVSSFSVDKVRIDQTKIKAVCGPTAHELWDPTPVEKVAFTDEFDKVRDSPLVWTNGWLACHDLAKDAPDWQGHKIFPITSSRKHREFSALPPFHSAGLSMGLRNSIFYDIPIIVPAPDRPFDTKTFVDIIEHAPGKIYVALLLPHMIEAIARSPEALKATEKLDYVGWGGGNVLAVRETRYELVLTLSISTLSSGYGTTEMGSAQVLSKSDPTLWQYHHFHPEFNGFEFRPVLGQEDVYELFIKKDPSLNQPVFQVFPHLDEWPTNDLFRPHPTLPHHWHLEGRADDLIVFMNGSKLNPRSIEAAVKQAPGVKDAMLFGSGRARPGVLIEPAEPHAEREADSFLDTVWPFLDATNSTMPTNGVVIRPLLLLAKPEKPLPRTGKLTLPRPAVLKLYKDEIDSLYDALPESLKVSKDYRIGASGEDQ